MAIDPEVPGSIPGHYKKKNIVGLEFPWEIDAQEIIYIYSYTYKNGCLCVCMSRHNSGTPGAISTKLGTHIAICMCKNITYVIYIYIYLLSINFPREFG
jgi:hypothetical protein